MTTPVIKPFSVKSIFLRYKSLFMKNRIKRFINVCAFIIAYIGFVQLCHANAKSSNGATPIEMTWQIKGITRKALVYIPPQTVPGKTPVIFAFHGHGGTMRKMYNTQQFDQLWPEAIFICPQGLNTAGQLVDRAGNLPGWQMSIDDNENTDLQFFDAMLKTLKENYRIDKQQVFITGHSNGGGFTYLLWAKRGNEIKAVAPTAAAALKLLSYLQPKPLFHLIGLKDPLVKPIWQKTTYEYVLKLNQCDLTSKKTEGSVTFYPSKTGNPVYIFTHNGGHAYPIGANIAIINFFKTCIDQN